MSNLYEIKEASDVSEVLSAATANSGEMEGVVVICLYKDGSQGLWTSSMNHHRKCFLAAFFTAWTTDWFKF